jgi:acetyl esterase/lipase
MGKYRIRYLPYLALVAVVAAALASCSPLRILNTFIPEDALVAATNIGYGPLPRQRLDVYAPKGGRSKRPVVVFFYGGAWQTGERGEYLFIAESLTSRGFVVVIPDYRLYPEVVFPEFIEDAARAVSWTHLHIAAHGGDAEQVFVMGHSAGAQIAALLAFDRRYLAAAGSSTDRLRGLISLAGPMDFLPLREEALERIFPVARREASQPINFVSAEQPPSLLLHGESDTRVYPRNSRNLAARIAERGAVVETQYLPGMGHIDILLALAAPLRDGKPVLDRVAMFIDAQSQIRTAR